MNLTSVSDLAEDFLLLILLLILIEEGRLRLRLRLRRDLRFMVPMHSEKRKGAFHEACSSGRESAHSPLGKFEPTHVGCYETSAAPCWRQRPTLPARLS